MAQTIRLPEQNHVTLVGRLTRDPDLRNTPKGTPVCRFDIALNRSYKDATGNWVKETDFVPVVAWREMATRCGAKLKKGHPVYVNGSLRSSSWEDKEGKKRSKLEVYAQRIQFLHSEDESSAAGRPAETTVEAAESSSDEEIPF